MKSSLVHAALLGFFLASSVAEAKTPLKTSPLRFPAEQSSVVFTRRSPDLQRAVNQEALKFYTALTSGTNWEESDRLNLDEFKLQGQSLEARGYTAMTEPLKGHVFSPAQSLTFRRDKALDQKITAAPGEPAAEIIVLAFDYEQVFLKKDTPAKANSVVPKTILHGMVFLHCELKSNKACPIEAISINESSIKWGQLPSTRGGESSAGG